MSLPSVAGYQTSTGMLTPESVSITVFTPTGHGPAALRSSDVLYSFVLPHPMTSGGAMMPPSGRIVTPVPPSPVVPELDEPPDPLDDPPEPLELPPEPLLLPPPLLLDPPPLLLLSPEELPDEEDDMLPVPWPLGLEAACEHPSATARDDRAAIFDSFMTNSRLLMGDVPAQSRWQ
jgi:hypothetical protein